MSYWMLTNPISMPILNRPSSSLISLATCWIRLTSSRLRTESDKCSARIQHFGGAGRSSAPKGVATTVSRDGLHGGDRSDVGADRRPGEPVMPVDTKGERSTVCFTRVSIGDQGHMFGKLPLPELRTCIGILAGLSRFLRFRFGLHQLHLRTG